MPLNPDGVWSGNHTEPSLIKFFSKPLQEISHLISNCNPHRCQLSRSCHFEWNPPSWWPPESSRCTSVGFKMAAQRRQWSRSYLYSTTPLSKVYSFILFTHLLLNIYTSAFRLTQVWPLLPIWRAFLRLKMYQIPQLHWSMPTHAYINDSSCCSSGIPTQNLLH